MPECSTERNHLCDFDRGHYGKHLWEIILNLDKWGQGEISFPI